MILLGIALILIGLCVFEKHWFFHIYYGLSLQSALYRENRMVQQWRWHIFKIPLIYSRVAQRAINVESRIISNGDQLLKWRI